MRNSFLTCGVALVLAGGLALSGCGGGAASGEPGGTGPAPGGRGGPGGPGEGGRGGGSALARMPMTVELAAASRAPMNERIMVVGNLIGAATVDVVPRVNGRLQAVNVRLGDPVRKGQTIAVVEDREIREQVRQAEASFEVSRATVRQREADLKFAQTSLERSQSLYSRQLISKQTLDDADARHQAATAQVDLARAQFEQSKARLEELRINLSNTIIVSPVDGFVGRRNLDAGAYVSQNAPVGSVVDISFVRLVVNLVEKDLRRVNAGMTAEVGVDAYPGEIFQGRVARVAPVLDPATRTAQMEVEVPNPGFRLKPGMYARVQITVDHRDSALVVPRNSIVDLEGKRGVFLAADSKAQFREVKLGLQDVDRVEILEGVRDGERIVTTGAAALKDGDTIVLAGQRGQGGGRGRGAGGGPGRGAGGGQRPAGGAPRGGQ